MREPGDKVTRAYVDRLAREEAFSTLHRIAQELIAEVDEARSTITWLRQTNQDIADERLAHEDLMRELLVHLEHGHLPTKGLIERVRKAVDDE